MAASDHITHLAGEIGPRGSTREGEAKAAEYAVDVITRLGLKPNVQRFISARSNWHPYSLFAAGMLVAVAANLIEGRIGSIVAIVLGGVCLLSVLLELTFRPNPLRWLLPKGDSQNVAALIRAQEQSKETVVLIGHLDTHRTPIAFSTDRWLRIFSVLIPVGLLASVSLLVIFGIGIFLQLELLRWLSILPGLVVVGLFAITIQADYSPYTDGANDNASGAGVVLGLAEQFAASPLTNTDLWIVLTGCEEVGCYGAEAFARAHKDAMPGAIWVTVDSIGGRQTALSYLTRETFLLSTQSDSDLLAMADAVANEFPDLQARRHQFAGAFTEGVIGGKHGFRLLTFIAVGPNGAVPNWHRPSDVLEAISQEAVDRCDSFIRNFLEKVDSSV